MDDVNAMRVKSRDRSRARYCRAALILGGIALDVEHADALNRIIARTGETRADFVRRMIREQDAA